MKIPIAGYDLVGAVGDLAQDRTSCAAPDLTPDEFNGLVDIYETQIMLRVTETVRGWELADARDAWRHTGEPKPITPPERRRPRTYLPSASTVDAFWHVRRLGKADYLANWLADHPADVPALYKIWKGS
jgi:hypothetical protein